jgi:hypothetical protein
MYVMTDAASTIAVGEALRQLAESVIAQVSWPEWHIEEVPASRVHGASVLLVFTSRAGRTREEVVVAVEQPKAPDEWTMDVTNSEGLPLDGTVRWDAVPGPDETLPLAVLIERLANLEAPIVRLLTDLPRD